MRKKRGLTTIDFGHIGHPARILTEEYGKVHGKRKVSGMVRKAVYLYLADLPELADYKRKVLLKERLRISERIVDLVEERKIVDAKLEILGFDFEGFPLVKVTGR